VSHSQNPILWVSTSSKWQIRQCLYALKTLKLKSPRLTRSGPRRYAGHTSGSTSLRTPGMEWVYQVWRKSQFKLVTFFLPQWSPQNDRRVTWIIRYHSVQSSSKNPTTSYTHVLLPPHKPPISSYPTTKSNLLCKNFVYRMLFKDISYHVLYIACCWTTALWQVVSLKKRMNEHSKGSILSAPMLLSPATATCPRRHVTDCLQR